MAVESVAGWPWNGWPNQHGINGRMGVEYATYACRCKQCIRTAKMPAQPLPGSRASASLLAQVMVSKHLDGLPLYRREKMAARSGLTLPRAKLARWLIVASTVLQPLVNLLNDTFFSYDVAHSDDTGIQVLKEDGRSAANQSALWIRRGGPPGQPVVLVDYTVSAPESASSLVAREAQDCLLSSIAGEDNVGRSQGASASGLLAVADRSVAVVGAEPAGVLSHT